MPSRTLIQRPAMGHRKLCHPSLDCRPACKGDRALQGRAMPSPPSRCGRRRSDDTSESHSRVSDPCDPFPGITSSDCLLALVPDFFSCEPRVPCDGLGGHGTLRPPIPPTPNPCSVSSSRIITVCYDPEVADPMLACVGACKSW